MRANARGVTVTRCSCLPCYLLSKWRAASQTHQASWRRCGLVCIPSPRKYTAACCWVLKAERDSCIVCMLLLSPPLPFAQCWLWLSLATVPTHRGASHVGGMPPTPHSRALLFAGILMCECGLPCCCRTTPDLCECPAHWHGCRPLLLQVLHAPPQHYLLMYMPHRLTESARERQRRGRQCASEAT